MFASAADNAAIVSIDVGIALGLMVLSRLLDPARLRDRVLFGLTAAALVVIYATWRWHDTLPPFEVTVASLWSRLFFAFELIAILYTLMSILILCRTIDRTPQADAGLRRMVADDHYPAVDVMICTYDEPLDVVERSILSALALDYPNVTVWVLDDTRRPWLRDYCAAVGARHVTRPDNKGAKAGNLNNGLAVTAAATNAPVILVLDADFAPRADFLRRTVALLMSDPAVALVQTPQFYYNADPIQHNLLASRSWVDDQRLFFDIFEPAKDAWGCAFCVGTSFVVRRDRLVEIGGFPSEAISEDVHLTCRLQAHGYHTWWLNEPLSFGLSAEGIPEFITQRARWCLGTIQVALLRNGPLRGRGFSLVQRWQYLHGIMNWLCKPFVVLLLIAPPLYWFGGWPAFEADYLAFLRYGVPALLGQIIYMAWISRSRTLPLFMEATHAISSFAITATLASALVKPFGRPFKVTDKGGDRSTPRVNGKLAAAFGLIALSSAASILWAFISPNAPSEISSLDFFNLLWAGIAMVIAFIAFVVCFELPRADEMFAADEVAHLWLNGTVTPCRIAALSVSRASLQEASGPGSPARGAAVWPPIAEHAPAGLHIDPLGWIDITLRPEPEGRATAELHLNDTQRRQLVARLYSASHGHIAPAARLGGAFAGLIRRGWRGH